MPFFVLLFVSSALITAGVRAFLVRHGVMDLPNARSSHAVPVPRGGGVGIVLVFLSAVVWILLRQVIPAKLAWALIGGGLAIAIVGFLDDRLQVGAVAAARGSFTGGRMGCLVSRCPWPLFNSGATRFVWVWVSRGVAFAGLIWLTNLFNFMDGIDGLAGMEAVCVSGFGAVLLFQDGLPSYAQLSWMLAAASLGFLVWNWPPAKIFMGDVGSGFLGFTLGTLALFSSKAGPD